MKQFNTNVKDIFFVEGDNIELKRRFRSIHFSFQDIQKIMLVWPFPRCHGDIFITLQKKRIVEFSHTAMLEIKAFIQLIRERRPDLEIEEPRSISRTCFPPLLVQDNPAIRKFLPNDDSVILTDDEYLELYTPHRYATLSFESIRFHTVRYPKPGEIGELILEEDIYSPDAEGTSIQVRLSSLMEEEWKELFFLIDEKCRHLNILDKTPLERRYSQSELAVRNFKPTRVLSDLISVNDEERTWYASSFRVGDDAEVYSMDNIIDVWSYSDSSTSTRTVSTSKQGGGVGRAVAGGLLAGSAGAIVGAATKKGETKTTTSTSYEHVGVLYWIQLDENGVEQSHEIDFRLGKDAVTAERILRSFMRNEQGEEPAEPEAPATSEPASDPADQLRKFKGLLDDGIISQEEFEAKKKQLLGL